MDAPARGVLSVAEALERVVAGLEPTPGENIALEEAMGRVLAQDVKARLTQPPFDASAMDGYAVRADDIASVPCALQVIGESAAGHPFPKEVRAGEAVRIFTGATVPQGADTIVIQEVTERHENRVTIRETSKKGAYLRPRGFDFSEGDALLTGGHRLNARDLALAATMNCAQVCVRRLPRVAILATGDELVSLGEQLGEGQIISSIPYGLAPMIERAGGQPQSLGIAKDTLASLAAHLEKASNADILITIGGASVGDHDLVQNALKTYGVTLGFWKIAMRPGKPLMFGTRGNQRVIGVPGNPVSAMICARLFLVPMLERMLGLKASRSGEMTVSLGADIGENGPRQHYMRAILSRDAQGRAIATPARSQDSSLLSPLASADCLLIRAPHAPAARAGDSLQALPLDF